MIHEVGAGQESTKVILFLDDLARKMAICNEYATSLGICRRRHPNTNKKFMDTLRNWKCEGLYHHTNIMYKYKYNVNMLMYYC